jgi:cell division protein FtsW (lipid II flippase)
VYVVVLGATRVTRLLRGILRSPALLVCLVLGLLGCLAIYNVTFHTATPQRFVLRQSIWLIVGLLTLAICSRIPAERYRRWTWLLSGVALIALYAVLIWGVRRNGMRGWFEIPLIGDSPIFQSLLVQPSELAKPIFVLFLAKLSHQRDLREAYRWRDYGTQVLWCLPWFIAIAWQPDFGTLLIYLLTFALLYWLQGGPLRHLAASAAALTPILAGICWRYPYVRERFIGFIASTANAQAAGWHPIQFRTTLARGGLWGCSMDDAVWSRHYLPLGYSDSIFATIAETVGLLGTLPLLAGVGLWFAYGIYHARRCASREAALIVAGLCAIVGLQALVHVSVAAQLLPPTGVTLPLLSYGGSSLVATTGALGILLAQLHERAVERL